MYSPSDYTNPPNVYRMVSDSCMYVCMYMCDSEGFRWTECGDEDEDSEESEDSEDIGPPEKQTRILKGILAHDEVQSSWTKDTISDWARACTASPPPHEPPIISNSDAMDS